MRKLVYGRTVNESDDVIINGVHLHELFGEFSIEDKTLYFDSDAGACLISAPLKDVNELTINKRKINIGDKMDEKISFEGEVQKFMDKIMNLQIELTNIGGYMPDEMLSYKIDGGYQIDDWISGEYPVYNPRRLSDRIVEEFSKMTLFKILFAHMQIADDYLPNRRYITNVIIRGEDIQIIGCNEKHKFNLDEFMEHMKDEVIPSWSTEDFKRYNEIMTGDL